MTSLVSTVKTTDGVDKSVRRAVDLAGGIDVRPGETVLIKPNMSCAKPSGSGLVTSVEVVAALVKLVKEMGAKPLVGDLPIVGWDPEETYRVVGIKTAVTRAGGEFVDFSKDEAVTIHIPNAKVLNKIKVVKTALTVDKIISVPVYKPHFYTGMTLCIKNLKGLTWQDQRMRIHVLGLYEPIVDLFQVFKDKVVFGLVDGTVGCDSVRPAGPYYGPTEGKAVKLDMLVAGRDAVAVDAVSERIAGLDPFEVKLTKLAHNRGLGQIKDIRIVGDRVGFAPLSQSLLGTFFNLLIPIFFTGTRISRFINPISTPLLLKRMFGPTVRTLHSVESDLKSSKVGSILLAGDCDGCGLCVKACKMNNIKLQRGTPIVGKDHCVRCLICVEICPKGALALSRV
jgi:uncharacterized protein (DUF362 family)/Pyruvate/2-oxoacid:ferredoxin oxidoreductase delta subunit